MAHACCPLLPYLPAQDPVAAFAAAVGSDLSLLIVPSAVIAMDNASSADVAASHPTTTTTGHHPDQMSGAIASSGIELDPASGAGAASHPCTSASRLVFVGRLIRCLLQRCD